MKKRKLMYRAMGLAAALVLALSCVLVNAKENDAAVRGDGYVDGEAPTPDDVDTPKGGSCPEISSSRKEAGLGNGSYGFFQKRGSTEATDVLSWGVAEEGSTVLGGAHDATNLDFMMKSLDYIDECNELRKKNGLNTLKVNDFMMAAAQVQLNWSDRGMKHSYFFAGDNLAWGAEGWNPFRGWYDEEKAAYDSGNRTWSDIGHYRTIVGDYRVTGFAMDDDSSYGYAYGETFFTVGGRPDYFEKAQTVADYRADLQLYIRTNGEYASHDFEEGEGYMYRLYNPNSGEHFFTANKGEAVNVVKAGWNYEGVAWTAPTSGDDVYRLYNANGGEHHYTTNVAEKDMLVKAGWKYEGVGWKSDTDKKTPLYRVYNPNEFANNHHYTTNQGERNHLVSLGWKDEGIGWYGK